MSYKTNLQSHNAKLRLLIEKANNLPGGGNIPDEPTDQTAKAGAYVADGTFSKRVYTWDEVVKNGLFFIDEEAEDWAVEHGEDRYLMPGYDYVIPDSVTNIGWVPPDNNIVLPRTTEVVFGTDALKVGTIYIKATTPPQLKDPAFYECTGEWGEGFGGIVILMGCGDTYKAETGWCDYAEYITEGEMPI